MAWERRRRRCWNTTQGGRCVAGRRGDFNAGGREETVLVVAVLYLVRECGVASSSSYSPRRSRKKERKEEREGGETVLL